MRILRSLDLSASPILLCFVIAVVVVPNAAAYEAPGRLNEAAHIYSLGVGEVRCPSRAEWDEHWASSFAWAYTNLRENYSVLGPEAQGRYHDYVANELVDYVDSHYRTIATKEARAIGGLSMGGRIASMTGLTHADRFSAVGAFSPAIRPDAEDAVRNVPAAAPFFYVSCGTLDSLLPINREFVGWLMERELSHEYLEAPGLGHTWALWDEQIGRFFDLLVTRGFKSTSS